VNLRNPSLSARKAIVGAVFGMIGVLAGMLLSLIPATLIVLMAVGGMVGAWVGIQWESDPNARQCVSEQAASHRQHGRRSSQSR
jgi:hypothetical protein